MIRTHPQDLTPFLTFAALSLVDVAVSAVAFAHGAHEANPLLTPLSALWGNGPMLGAKMAVCLTGGWLARNHWALGVVNLGTALLAGLNLAALVVRLA